MTLATLAALAGCGGSSTPAAGVTSSASSPSPAATLPAHTGLVGAVDSARRLAVCENVRLFATTVEGGLQDSADEAFAAIVATLRQPPHEPGLLRLARRWERWRRTHGDAVLARRLTTFCAAPGG